MFGNTPKIILIALVALPAMAEGAKGLRKITQPIGNAVSTVFSVPNKIIFHSFLSSELPKDYQSKSAKEKLDILWANCIKDTKSSGHTPNHEALPVFFRDMNDTFDVVSDERPWRGKKPIHGAGYVMKGKFEASPSSPYTGVFKGCKNLLMRPAPGFDPASMLLAGISIKFLIDGLPSVNYVSLFKGGTDKKDFNWFGDIKSHLGTDIVPPIGPPLMMKFRTAKTQFGSQCGICDMGEVDEKGRVEKKPKFPFELTLTVNPKFDGLTYDELPGKIKSGSKLYDVYAREWNEKSPSKYIGSITTTSDMTTSWYGDRKLFFQHIRREKDLDGLKAICPDGKCPVAH